MMHSAPGPTVWDSQECMVWRWPAPQRPTKRVLAVADWCPVAQRWLPEASITVLCSSLPAAHWAWALVVDEGGRTEPDAWLCESRHQVCAAVARLMATREGAVHVLAHDLWGVLTAGAV